MRALLSQAPFETMSAIASHYLGRPATPPIALSLEAAWDVLGDPQQLAEEIDKLSPTERRVLEGVEHEGGEVDTEELLELEREPLRLRTATGADPVPPRRRLLARAPRAAHPGPPEPPRRAHRGERDHRRRAPQPSARRGAKR